MSSKKHDVGKKCHWQRTIREAAGGAMSIRGVCPAASVEGESVLLVAAQAQGGSGGKETAEAKCQRELGSFASVSNEAGAADAEIELVLGGC